jgi:hypothetical protein
MAKRTKVDWSLVKRQYEAGQHSIRKLARLHGCVESAIRKRRDKFGWKRDLSAAVKERTRRKLVEQLAREARVRERIVNQLPAGAQHDGALGALDPDASKTPEEIEAERDEVVEAASNRKTEIVTYHQKVLRTLTEAAHLLGQRCKQYLEDPAGFDEKKKPFRNKRETPIDVLVKCAGIQAKLIPLERQAYSLDEIEPGDEAATLVERWAKHIDERRKAGKRVPGDDDE